MGKDRLCAFMDAILAIIMTILVLELEKPAAATFAALWELRLNFLAYVVSFFWLGAMWVNLHGGWQKVEKISNSTVWWTVVMLFCSSLIPYVTNFVSNHFMSSFAQICYGITVIAVTLSNIALNRSVAKANAGDRSLHQRFMEADKMLWLDIGIKVAGIMIAAFFFPPASIIGIMIAGFIPIISFRRIHE